MKEIPYIRVGTSYYKTVKAPTIAGHFNEILVSWSIETIRQDHGKSYLSKIPKHDGFTCIPNHIDFKQEYKGFYNIYSPLGKEPIEGEISLSLKFVKHIFGKHFELGLDYLQLLYLKPIQILPILCLVSKERSTGKSTFLKWLKEIFDNNEERLKILSQEVHKQFISMREQFMQEIKSVLDQDQAVRFDAMIEKYRSQRREQIERRKNRSNNPQNEKGERK